MRAPRADRLAQALDTFPRGHTPSSRPVHQAMPRKKYRRCHYDDKYMSGGKSRIVLIINRTEGGTAAAGEEQRGKACHLADGRDPQRRPQPENRAEEAAGQRAERPWP